MADVFISYSTHDINRASAIRSLLTKNDISCWMGDKDIHASNTYTVDITKAIEHCRIFVLVLSSYSQESSYVLSEFECAISNKKTIIPFIIENFRIEEQFNFHIRSRQAIAAFEDWKAGEQKLLETVKHLLSVIPPETKRKITDAVWSNVQPNPVRQSPKKPYVQCPYCGCTVLKRRRLFVDRYLYNQNKILQGTQLNTEALLKKLMKKGGSIKVITDFSLMVLLLIAALATSQLETSGSTNTLILNEGSGSLLIFCGIIAIRFLISLVFLDYPSVSEELIKTISQSGYKHWSFKCAGCEELFSILLPKDDKLEERVEKLLDNKKGT